MQYHVLKSKRDCFLTRQNNNLQLCGFEKEATPMRRAQEDRTYPKAEREYQVF